MKPRLLIGLAILGLALTVAGCSPGGGSRATKPAADLTGTWKQTQPASPRTFTFTIDGEVLIGTVLMNSGSLAITNGIVKGDQVSFQTYHEASSPKGTFVTETFTGTLSDDTVTGTLTIKTTAADFGSRPWQIERETAASEPAASR